jgi:hypothetical protein
MIYVEYWPLGIGPLTWRELRTGAVEYFDQHDKDLASIVGELRYVHVLNDDQIGTSVIKKIHLVHGYPGVANSFPVAIRTREEINDTFLHRKRLARLEVLRWRE